MLDREKIPFALAALLGLLSWTLTRAIDRVLEAPLIKYTQTESRRDGARHVVFAVENISTTLYTGLELEVLLDRGSIVKSPPPRLEAVSPMLSGGDEPVVADNSAAFTVPEVQPGGQLRIAVRVTEDAVPRLGMRNPKAAGRLVRPSIRTWLVENELGVLLVVALAGVALAAGYVYALARSKEPTHAKNADAAEA